MKNRAAFEIQLASILEALTKAAMTEISRLVEDGAVALRLEVSQSHKEIDSLRRKLQQVENKRTTTLETATRESRSVGVQIVNQCDAAGGAAQGGAGAPLVEQLDEKRCKTETNGAKADFGFAVKKEQEEEQVAQVRHQTESEHSAGRLNNEYAMFETDHPLWSFFTQGDSNVTDDPVCSNATEQCSQNQSIFSPIQHTPATMEMCGRTLSTLGKDGHVVGDVKEEAGGQCLYSARSRSEMGETQRMERGQPPLSTNDNLTSQVFQPVQRQLRLLKGVAENSPDPVSCSNKNANIPRRPGTGEKRFSCAVCHKRFFRFFHLERHQRIHTGEKPFICVECGKQFTSRCNLISHERVHTGNKPFDCAQCGKRFSLRCNLNRHERIHTGNKPFGCVHCGKRFAQGSNLRAHDRIHTGERPYHCAQCEKSFTQLSGLRTHQKTHSRN